MYTYRVFKAHEFGYCLSREIVCNPAVTEYYNILSKDWSATANHCWVKNFELFKHCVDKFSPEVSELNCIVI